MGRKIAQGLAFVIFLWLALARAQQFGGLAPPLPSVIPPPFDPGSPFSPELQARALLRNRTQQLTDEVASKFSFCIVNGNEDRDLAFDYTDDSFIRDCANGGSLLTRLCGRAEIELYFKSLQSTGHAVEQNLNCNVSNWSDGCEAGWASSVSQTEIPDEISVRNLNPQPCCDGFFCPRGLSCMIPCPLGAYCPRAIFNETSGNCDPYGYGRSPNVVCGGADRWADVTSSPGVYCEPGQYCPSPVLTQSCTSGNYCREGATSPKRCYKFTSCKTGSDRQNLRVYGALFITILAMSLVLVYSCSDQVMNFRDKRKSKAREKAARQAREHVSAMERWKVTKEVSKRAKTFSSKFSRTFSRKRVKSSEEIQELTPMGFSKSHDQEHVVMQASPTGTHPPQLAMPPMAYAAKHGGVHMDKSSDTESQIFGYAFRQIEQEKATDFIKESTANMVADGGRKRPLIELRFENLTMVLKKTGKRILSNVTGKLTPGDITAIMGPSGAGKTTFLNAVAGKAASECNTTGHMYINGKQGSIRSYRKIIGFVPQDDIVHGSLTVEENLVFSSKYRLSVDLPKRERVLLVERIISSLGLGPIRDSLVGTVEKRGISGGQRKRVNVGLEMVMEPSLLILDEPTSGLDSTSSRLVVQALRREAMLGVNVVVVLHQPSYGLFMMFDYVMFLAKGGRTAYLGPVADVESYFISLGVVVPERINPPDHYMDLLEGVVKPEGNPTFDPSMLPIIWMQHEGHPIPDELKEMAAVAESDFSIVSRKKLEQTKTFREEAWQELKEPVVVWWDGIRHAVFSVPDITGRKIPGFFSQFSLILGRVSKQRFREARLLVQDYIILFLAGICVGLLADAKDQALGANGYPYSIIALSLLCMISALRTFSADKLQFWRESASGINRVAFFLAKDTVDHFNTVVKPFVYLSMFYFFCNPRSTFISNYIITLAFIYCITGIAYVFAILMQPSTAQLCCVFFPVVSTLVATRTGATGILKVLIQGSYARWALEAYVVANAQRYSGVWLITRCGALARSGYDLNHFNLCVAVLIAYGIGARAVALLSLFFSNRKKQR
ncbi:hypothetical protein SELMODRAFT_443919 [Selaginella moellendorffii]|uniref:ABC transporter domain-containing protein n=1 Tax=Selaginella moellendorffii TaxID=88036 RepID=D8S5J6_SELML|nr:ABC transporter G family member 28 [Selaginella moellendorffii]EFJ20608.1 hypothetical protein SELMODRAFT_443919 [Selaginella moellendorffii]|eukprot:XP_002978622.1 ABC transporter G family member 28 [Selaginella moellendorffii]